MAARNTAADILTTQYYSLLPMYSQEITTTYYYLLLPTYLQVSTSTYYYVIGPPSHPYTDESLRENIGLFFRIYVSFASYYYLLPLTTTYYYFTRPPSHPYTDESWPHAALPRTHLQLITTYNLLLPTTTSVLTSKYYYLLLLYQAGISPIHRRVMAARSAAADNLEKLRLLREEPPSVRRALPPHTSSKY